jgi:hypothetical protein
MSHKPKPHPKNVEGDFYVEDGCCTGCMVPEYYAPNLVVFDESDLHCFIAKQPSDDSELYQAIKVTWASEVECIRYSGNNPQILRRLAEAGAADCCDQKHLVQEIKPLLRNHVTFERPKIKSQLELAGQLKEYVSSQSTEHLHYRVSEISRDSLGFTFSFCWFENNYYPVWFNWLETQESWHIFHSIDYEKAGSRAVSLMIDEWLRTDKTVSNIKWYSNAAWDNFLIQWQETPI